MSRAVMIMGGVGISFANTYLDYINTILIFKYKVFYEKNNEDGMLCREDGVKGCGFVYPALPYVAICKWHFCNGAG